LRWNGGNIAPANPFSSGMRGEQMKALAAVLGVLLSSSLVVPAYAQLDRPWWVAFETGAGQLNLTSNQNSKNGLTTFAMDFSGGHRVTRSVRVGLHVNGWLLQAADLYDPTVGEGVSSVSGIVDVFPIRRTALFLRGGGGVTTYWNNQPAGRGGSGPSFEAGAGYDFQISRHLSILPMVEYYKGGLGSGFAPAAPGSSLGYSVVEFKAGILYRFGGQYK
jgi:hypothetical protein